MIVTLLASRVAGAAARRRRGREQPRAGAAPTRPVIVERHWMHDRRAPTPAFGISLWESLDAPTILHEVQLAEQSGFDAVWLGDSQLLWREAYVLLGAASALTTRVLLGVGVTNPVTRHPTVTASALLTLQEASCGRALMGVGVGSTAVRTLGQQPVSRAELTRWVELVRAL